MRAALFVGGPLHGREREIRDDTRSFLASVPGSGLRFQTVEYRLRFIGNNEPLMVLAGLTDREAIAEAQRARQSPAPS